MFNIFSIFSSPWSSIFIILFIVELVIVELILRESSIYYTPYFRIINIAIAAYIVGALFKILHWANGDKIILVSLSVIALTYFIRTANKKKLTMLDISKCLWLTLACAATVVNLFHWKYGDIISVADVIAFTIMAILFFLSPPQKNKKDLYPEDTEGKPIDQI